jgi:hypothetical protein
MSSRLEITCQPEHGQVAITILLIEGMRLQFPSVNFIKMRFILRYDILIAFLTDRNKALGYFKCLISSEYRVISEV